METETLKTKQTNLNPIRIYVACLAAYNNGILHGVWIDATQGEGGIWLDVSQMLLKSPAECAEEFAIHDYEGFKGISISEYESFARIAELAEFIEEHGYLGADIIQYFGGDIDEAKETMRDRYFGEYDSMADYARELTEDTVEIPQALQFYIDYEGMGRDMAVNDVLVVETGHSVHLFGWA